MTVVRIDQTAEFDAWLESLVGQRVLTKVAARIANMAEGNDGDWKAVGKGVCESRIHHGPGYRLYFTRRGREVVLLLAGGDKSTQAADIRLAQRLAAALRTESLKQGP